MNSPTYILGISCFYHDAAACLIKDGQLVAAAAEERFTRKKHDNNFPSNAIAYCLKEASIEEKDIDAVGFYEKPLLKFERIVEVAANTWPKSYKSFISAIPQWLRKKLWIKENIQKELKNFKGEIYFTEHHVAHAASSYLVSPFKEAAIVTLDGVGEWATTTIGQGTEEKINIREEIHFPHSLGLLYAIITHYLGFKPNSAEYKVMGLAPYGKPVYQKEIENLIELKKDGSFKLNMDILTHDESTSFYDEEKMKKLFGFPPRIGGPLSEAHKNLAASIQTVTEKAVLAICRHAYELTKSKNLCLAGGVALNCVANGKILAETPFENIFIEPAAGDDGGALGVAFYIWTNVLKNKRSFELKHSSWGPQFSDKEIEDFLEKKKIPYEKFLSEEELVSKTAKLIAEPGNALGWFQGRMEWGPRALGNRSILADPRREENRDLVNLKIKFREDFRPFAPAVLRERASEFFDLDAKESPFMLLVNHVKDGKKIPAVTHVDGSARPQTVSKEENLLFHKLIKAFEKETGCPVLINTSFNVSGEPIVLNPEHAFNVFRHTNMDALVMGNFLILKKQTEAAFPRNTSW